jgi:putative hemolysin
MGSSLSEQSIIIAAACGVLYLVFDAARYFLQRVSPVRLRRWSGADPQFERGSRWFRYDPQSFSLLSGALLQMALVAAVSFTVVALRNRGFVIAASYAILLWAVVTVVWKFILAWIPEEIAEVALRSLIPVSHLFYYIFWPFLFPLRWALERVERRRDLQEEETPTEEEVQAYIDVGEEEGIIEEEEGKLIQSIVDFGDKIAKELMTPRIDMLSFEVNRPSEELARLFSESKYSRIPIYEGNTDKIVGIVHIKDLFDALLRNEKRTVRELAHPAYFVPETKLVSELLREFQIEHLQIAVVVDEYGGTAGLITIEDIIEEIVGEIADEHEDSEEAVVEIENGVYLVNGVFRVDSLEDLIHADIRGEGYETVAGLIFTNIGRVPKPGEVVRKNGVIFEVERADRKRIHRVRVYRDPEYLAAAEGG